MMNDDELKALILSSKAAKKEWLMYLVECSNDEVQTVESLCEALALAELHAQVLFLKRQRPQQGVDK